MTKNTSFRVSQDFELVPPKKGRAYPIPQSEWNFLKERVRNIRDYTNWFYSVGWLFWGAALSSLISIITTTAKPEEQFNRLVLWSVLAVTALVGTVCFICGRFLRKAHNVTTEEVVQHMDIIQQRFETEESL